MLTTRLCRRLANFDSKWLSSGIMAHAAEQLGEDDGAVVQLHCQWNQMATATGRLSSSNPNMQARVACRDACQTVMIAVVGWWCDTVVFVVGIFVMSDCPVVCLCIDPSMNVQTSTQIYCFLQTVISYPLCIMPPAQAVTKYEIELQQQDEPACTINIRDAFVAPPGACQLILFYHLFDSLFPLFDEINSFDYHGNSTLQYVNTWDPPNTHHPPPQGTSSLPATTRRLSCGFSPTSVARGR